MSNVVNKIKQKVRSRSNSRSSVSSPTARGSTDIPEVPRIPDRNSAVYNTSPTMRNDAYPRSSLDHSAFHVTRGSVGRASMDGPVSRKPLPANGSNAVQQQQQYQQHTQYDDSVPERFSSRHGAEQTQTYTQGHTRGRSGADYQPNSVAGGMTSDESSFYTADTTPNRSVRAAPSDYDDPNYAEYPIRTSSRRVSIPDHSTPRPHPDAGMSKPLPHVPDTQYNNMSRQDQNYAPASTNEPVSSSSWMSPLISTGQRQSQSYEPSRRDSEQAAKYEAVARGHLRLPEGFNLQNTEVTHVYETQRPAVTQETVLHQRTEIYQEEISKDIHIHHYYTHAQPIHLVEVLPPKHFFLDPETGIKTEIAPPFGWSMPANMFPVSPDARHVKGWTRHYLVNDEFPYGIPESEPLPGTAAVTLKPNYALRPL